MTDYTNIESYDYQLPEKNIAQIPAENRDGSRLMVVDSKSGDLHDKKFLDIVDYFSPNDLIILNDTKVFPARLLGHKTTGGKAELMLLYYPFFLGQNQSENGYFKADAKGLIRSSKRPGIGSKIIFGPDLYAVVEEFLPDAVVAVSLFWRGELEDILGQYGKVPLPPYIDRNGANSFDDRERYQTIYARENGAIAAPTAGLHFTQDLFDRLIIKGVSQATVTLHVGYGTFAPVRTEDITQHKIHSEFVTVPEETVQKVNQARRNGGKVWAVGTTTARALEFACKDGKGIRAVQENCELYIYPGYKFQVVDNLITNFHLPRSSLLFMVSALAGHQLIMDAYLKALEQNYRFYSYGDAMLILAG